MILSPLLKAQLQSVLKKSNQRIAQLAATYGNKSFTFQNYANILDFGPLQPYVKERHGVTQKGVYLGDLNVLDIRKVFRAVETGKLTREELNQIIGKMAGVHVDSAGDLQANTMEKGIQTISEIRKQTKKRLINRGEDPRGMDKEQLDRETEAYFDFSTNFQTSYNETVKDMREPNMRKHEIIGKLWDPGKKSYNDLVEIKKAMDTWRRNNRREALKLEDE